MDNEEALEKVRKARPIIQPNAAFASQLVEYNGFLHAKKDIVNPLISILQEVHHQLAITAVRHLQKSDVKTSTLRILQEPDFLILLGLTSQKQKMKINSGKGHNLLKSKLPNSCKLIWI